MNVYQQRPKGQKRDEKIVVREREMKIFLVPSLEKKRGGGMRRMAVGPAGR